MNYINPDFATISPNRLVPYYLMSCYLYYELNTAVITDIEFDYLCSMILKNWDDINHRHKKYLTKETLQCGSGYQYYWFDMPTIIKSAAVHWYKGG